MVVDKIWMSGREPSNPNVLWCKPVGGGMAFYIFNNGRWQPVSIVDDKGTATPSDDTKIEGSAIGQTLEKVIDSSISLRDTTDSKEYPDVF